MNVIHQGAVFKWLVGVLTALVVGLAGHALGYERAILRVDAVNGRVEMVEKEIIGLRAGQLQIGSEVIRDRTDTNKALDKIDESLNDIYQELRKMR